MQFDFTMLERYTKLANFRAKASKTNAANQLKTILERHWSGHRVYKDLDSDAVLHHFQKIVDHGGIDFPASLVGLGRLRFENVSSYFTDHVELVFVDKKVAIFFVDYQHNTLGATIVDLDWLIPLMVFGKLNHIIRQQHMLGGCTKVKGVPRL